MADHHRCRCRPVAGLRHYQVAAAGHPEEDTADQQVVHHDPVSENGNENGLPSLKQILVPFVKNLVTTFYRSLVCRSNNAFLLLFFAARPSVGREAKKKITETHQD